MKEDGPAFPCPSEKTWDGQGNYLGEQFIGYPGMSLRDWFAGMAMLGLFHIHEPIAKAAEAADLDRVGFHAVMAYGLADAMLEEREK